MSFQWSRSDTSIGEGFLRIAREQIGKAVAGAEDETDTPEARVHEARRRCKKLRALFRLARPGFPDYEAANAFVRDAAQGLAQARDTRVIRKTLADLMRWAGAPIEIAAADGHHGVETESLSRFAAQMRELDAQAAGWRLDGMTSTTLATGLKRTYRRGRQTRRAARRLRSDEAFHEWRKYAKYHWSQLGLIEECALDVLPSAHRSVGELAEVLGLHHDIAVLEGALEREPAELGPGIDLDFVRDAAERRQAELEARIEVLGRQVFAETPKALKARFSTYLEGWAATEAAA